MSKVEIESDLERRIYVNDIDPTDCVEIVKQIHAINAEDDKNEETYADYERKPIDMYISSYGGSIYDGLTVVDAMEKSKTPIHTHVNYAMSMGFIISLFGHKRTCNKYARFMWHSMSAGTIGKLKDMEEDMVENKYLQEVMDKITLSRTKLTKKKLKEIIDAKKDFYFNADDALAAKIVDGIE